MRAAGLTKAGMYHYFSSKEEILDAAIDYGIAQYIAQEREVMEGLSVEEKMLRFTKGSSPTSGLFNKLIQLKQNDKDSYAAYRIRERSIHAYIPVMEGIVSQGVAQDIYQAEYPRQAAEFIVLLAKALVDPNALPPASKEDQALRMRAFLQLMEVWLHPAPDHMAKVTALLEDEIL